MSAGEEEPVNGVTIMFAHPPHDELVFEYVNHKGVRATRRVVPTRLWFGSSMYYKDRQWLLSAMDMDKQQFRTFALSKVENPRRVRA